MNGKRFWSPSNRFWEDEQYLQVDFLRKTRVTKVAVQSFEGMRSVAAYRLLASSDGYVWETVTNGTTLKYIGSTAQSFINNPYEMRYYRFIIESTNDRKREYENIAVKLEFYGCYIDGDDNANLSKQCIHVRRTFRFLTFPFPFSPLSALHSQM